MNSLMGWSGTKGPKPMLGTVSPDTQSVTEESSFQFSQGSISLRSAMLNPIASKAVMFDLLRGYKPFQKHESTNHPKFSEKKC